MVVKKDKPKLILKSLDIEVALSYLFDYRRNIIIPNLSWGIGIHECDIFIIRTNSGYAIECEIKISKSDLLNDANKKHDHSDNRIKEFYFAIPEYLYESCKDFIPKHAGIITCEIYRNKPKATIVRKPIANKNARKLTQEEQFKIAKLGLLRVWRLKEKLCNLNKK